jgi:hypothetical protein
LQDVDAVASQAAEELHARSTGLSALEKSSEELSELRMLLAFVQTLLQTSPK